MKTLHAISLAALMTTVSVPAFAAWDRLGTVDFGRRTDTERQFTGLDRPISQLGLSTDADVTCRSVRATFDNGRSREVFSGTLRARDVPTHITLRGADRNVRDISFTCRALGSNDADIAIFGEVIASNDRDRDRDRRSDNGPGWNLNTPIGSVTFGRRYEREREFAGLSGRAIQQIAVRAVDSDAQCRSMSVRFGNGRAMSVPIGAAGGMLREDQVYRVDLPGNRRDVTQVSMVCRARGDNRVTVQLLGDRNFRFSSR